MVLPTPGAARFATTLTLCLQWERPEVVPIEDGGAPRAWRRLRQVVWPTSLEIRPMTRSGAEPRRRLVAFTGVAANRSFATGPPVATSDLSPGLPTAPVRRPP